MRNSVSVSLYSNASTESYDKPKGQICNLIKKKHDIPGNAVYLTYRPVNDWGWNGSNF